LVWSYFVVEFLSLLGRAFSPDPSGEVETAPTGGNAPNALKNSRWPVIEPNLKAIFCSYKRWVFGAEQFSSW
jgi:hypothetical protein